MAREATDVLAATQPVGVGGHWLPRVSAPLLALCYPFVLMAYRGAIGPALGAGGGAVQWAAALALLVLAYAIPLATLAVAIRLAAARASPAARRIALLAVAAPPMLVLFASYRGALPQNTIWAVFWAALAAVALLASGDTRGPVRTPATGAAVARKTHMNALIGIGIAAYLLFHLANQLGGWLGAERYDRLMDIGRTVYRSTYIEPILIGLIALQLASALYLYWRDSVGPQDRFRTLQIASGCYLVFFLLSHLNATLVFGRLFLGGNTGFAFATGGPGGLLRSDMLIVYYGLAVFFAMLHVALGVRHRMLLRGAKRVRANRMVTVAAATGAVVAVVIIAGLGYSSSLLPAA